MNSTKRKAKAEKISARRKGKFVGIHSVDELKPGTLVAGRGYTIKWGNEFHFSINDSVATYRHRQDPVPGIGNGRYTSAYRSPKGIKQLLIIADQRGRLQEDATTPEPLGRRKPKNLPVAFDDARRNETKNWKAQRKTQWKTKPQKSA